MSSSMLLAGLAVLSVTPLSGAGRRQKNQVMILRAPEVQHYARRLSIARIMGFKNLFDYLTTSEPAIRSTVML
jgi:hypothetical protein